MMNLNICRRVMDVRFANIFPGKQSYRRKIVNMYPSLTLVMNNNSSGRYLHCQYRSQAGDTRREIHIVRQRKNIRVYIIFSKFSHTSFIRLKKDENKDHILNIWAKNDEMYPLLYPPSFAIDLGKSNREKESERKKVEMFHPTYTYSHITTFYSRL